MGIKSSLTCDVCGHDVPLTDHFAQIQLNAHEMKWEEEEENSPFRLDVEHVKQMASVRTRVMCLACGEAIVKTVERLVTGRKKVKPEVAKPKRYRLLDLEANIDLDLGTYEAMYGRVDDTDRERMVFIAKDLASIGHLVCLMEVE